MKKTMRFICEDPTPFIEALRVAASVLGEGVLRVEDPTITLRGMDGAQVIYIKTVIHSTFFLDPQFTRRIHAAYDFEELHKLVSTAWRGADEIVMEFSDDDMIIITAHSDTILRRFTQTPLDYEYVDKTAPEVEYEHYADIPTKPFITALRESKIHGEDKINIKVNEESLTIQNSSPAGEYYSEFQHDSIIEGEHTASYTTDLILRALPSIGDYVSIGLKDDGILHLKSEGLGIEHEAFISPRINTD